MIIHKIHNQSEHSSFFGNSISFLSLREFPVVWVLCKTRQISLGVYMCFTKGAEKKYWTISFYLSLKSTEIQLYQYLITNMNSAAFAWVTHIRYRSIPREEGSFKTKKVGGASLRSSFPFRSLYVAIFMCLKSRFTDYSSQLYLNYPLNMDRCLESFLQTNVDSKPYCQSKYK